MRFWDDGAVAVSLERRMSILRIHPCVPEDEHPPFSGSGVLVNVRDCVATLAGLRAETLSRAHLRLIARAFLEEGIHTLVEDRAPGHRLPMGELIVGGVLDGLYTIDLRKIRFEGRRGPADRD